MVGQLIRLKLRIIWNTVRKQTVVLVLAVLGVLYFGGIYASALVGTAFLARSDESYLAAPVMPIVGPSSSCSGWSCRSSLPRWTTHSIPCACRPTWARANASGLALAAATAGGARRAPVRHGSSSLPVWFALWRAQWIEALGWLTRRRRDAASRGAVGARGRHLVRGAPG